MNLEGNILVLTQWSFKDALVQTYTLPYVNIIRQIIPKGTKIFLVTAEQPKIALSSEEIVQVNKEWEKENMQLLPEPYKRFGVKKLAGTFANLSKIYRVIKNNNVKVIHAFCTPAGSIGYLLSKLTGAKLIIDSYEPHAESMVENGTWKEGGAAYRILFSLERKQTKRAAALIATTAGMRDYAKQRYNEKVRNFFVKPACVDLEKFSVAHKDPTVMKELGLEGKVVCVYAGKLGGIYLKQDIFNFIRACHDHWQGNFRFLMLTNAGAEEIAAEIKRTGLPETSVISRFVYHQDIPKYLSVGDFALNPVKSVPTKRYCTSIKDGEYWATGLPIVVSPNISDDSTIIQEESIGVVMDFTDKQQYLPAILKLESLLEQEGLKNKIRAIGGKYRSYNIAEKIYRTIYSN